MKTHTILLTVLLLFFYPTKKVESSWFIDYENFHVSVHGQLSCRHCHADITEKKKHPDVEDVNKTLNDFFRTEQCAECHKEIIDDINNEGTHAEEVIEECNVCIYCHDPHYQTSYSDPEKQKNNERAIDKKCGSCHELQGILPVLSSEDEACMACHRSIPEDDPEKAKKISNLCFKCHAEWSERVIIKSPAWYPLIDVNNYGSTVHAEIPCIKCHLRSTEFSHNNQALGDCRTCHIPHNEKIAHDAHLDVACEACHLNEVKPVKDQEKNRVLWQKYQQPGISKIHQILTTGDDAFCGRCHFRDNDLGASASALPPKSIICMPCHAATFSVFDAHTLIALFVFIIGIINLILIWFSGKQRERKKISHTGFFTRIYKIIKVMIFDVLLQRRLFRISRIRWLIHALIFYPIIFRFGWGLVALLSSIWFNEWPGVWIMLDKNHPLTALLFDITGTMLIIGVICMAIRTKMDGSTTRLEGLPERDWLAYGLLMSIFLAGFILEGMRIYMTGSPQGSEFAFLGYGISRLFFDTGVNHVYGYIWYLHAILAGAFVAYLPFSRMFHMIVAPIILAVKAYSRE